MADIINRLNVGQTVNVKLTDSAVTNGQNLVAAYNYAKTLTPNGAALSATNRVAVIIQPGNYTLAAELAVDTPYVDIIGLGAIKLERGAVPAVIIGGNTLNIAANDVQVKGISVGTQEFKSGNNLPLQRLEDCTGGEGSFSAYGTAAGTFINCSSGDYGFGYGGTASGTFINCSSGVYSFASEGDEASGIFINCTGGSGSFGIGGIAPGTFTNCTGGSGSFGGFGTASGTFTNCTSGHSSFGVYGTASGKFYQCRLTSGSGTFQTVSGAGLMRECIDGNDNIVDQ